MIRRLFRPLVYRLRQLHPWLRERRALKRLYAHPGVSRQARIIGAERIVLGKDVRIHPFATIDCRKDPFLGDDSLGDSQVVLEEGTTICSHAMLLPYGGRIALGKNCSVNPYTILYGHGGLTIGKDTRIAAHTVIVPANHVFSDPHRPICTQGVTAEGIVLGSDIWIGAHVTILDGVTLGDGSVVAAQSVVTRSFSPYSVIAGVPARILKERGEQSPSLLKMDVFDGIRQGAGL
ncbi:MAG TPA: acyltransferase [Chthonomonadaceae bacterium]|nr:acyltransferase [Chthonomonadaceae bacterium]